MSQVKVTHLPSIVEHSIDLVTRLALQRFAVNFSSPWSIIRSFLITRLNSHCSPSLHSYPCSFLSRVVSDSAWTETRCLKVSWRAESIERERRNFARNEQILASVRTKVGSLGAGYICTRFCAVDLIPRTTSNIKWREIDVKDDVLTKKHTRN